MRYTKIIIYMMIICLLLAGCSFKPYIKDGESQPTQTNNIDETGLAPGSITNGVGVSNTPSVQPTPTPEPVVSGKSLNFNILNSLDNTKYSWWINLNEEHKTPGIPAEIKALIDRNSGIYVGDTTKKKVYLTFDEGYENGYTPAILDTLKANNVKAIFFVTGSYIKSQEQLVRRMLDEGHIVGNHTINHPSLPGVANEALENEMYGLEKDFQAKFGVGFKYMRPPMGEYSEKTLVAAQQLGYKMIFWSFAYADWDNSQSKGANYAHDIVMKNLHNGAVILLHAVSKDNTEALDRIIKDIRAQGYEISPFDL